MRDRLADLVSLNQRRSEDIVTVTVEDSTFMEDFFNKVREVQTVIDKISFLVEEVCMQHNIILSSPTPEEKIKQELEMFHSEIKTRFLSVQIKLKDMQEGLPKDENTNSASVHRRIQKAQHVRLSRRFADVMALYEEEQSAFRTRTKDQIRRQLEITGQVTTDEELENMLQSGNPAVFTSSIISDSRVTQQALNEIESRQRDILRMESQIHGLHDMFFDIALLVETEGEMIDNIEKNVMSATEQVNLGKEEINKALKHKKQARRLRLLPSFVSLFKSKASVTNPL